MRVWSSPPTNNGDFKYEWNAGMDNWIRGGCAVAAYFFRKKEMNLENRNSLGCTTAAILGGLGR